MFLMLYFLPGHSSSPFIISRFGFSLRCSSDVVYVPPSLLLNCLFPLQFHFFFFFFRLYLIFVCKSFGAKAELILPCNVSSPSAGVAASSFFTSGKYAIDPELRGAEFERITQNLDVHFWKTFWNITETEVLSVSLLLWL